MKGRTAGYCTVHGRATYSSLCRWCVMEKDMGTDGKLPNDEGLGRIRLAIAKERAVYGRDWLRKLPFGKELDALDVGIAELHPDDRPAELKLESVTPLGKYGSLDDWDLRSQWSEGDPQAELLAEYDRRLFRPKVPPSSGEMPWHLCADGKWKPYSSLLCSSHRGHAEEASPREVLARLQGGPPDVAVTPEERKATPEELPCIGCGWPIAPNEAVEIVRGTRLCSTERDGELSCAAISKLNVDWQRQEGRGNDLFLKRVHGVGEEWREPTSHELNVLANLFVIGALFVGADVLAPAFDAAMQSIGAVKVPTTSQPNPGFVLHASTGHTHVDRTTHTGIALAIPARVETKNAKGLLESLELGEVPHDMSWSATSIDGSSPGAAILARMGETGMVAAQFCEAFIRVHHDEFPAELPLTRQQVRDLFTGQTPITKTIAYTLERLFGEPATLWLEREKLYREAQAVAARVNGQDR